MISEQKLKEVYQKIIVALDLDDYQQIQLLVEKFLPEINKFKIGLIPFTLGGPQLIKQIKQKGAEVFLDLKLYDIPNTMVKTAEIITQLGVWGFTIHIKSGVDAMRQVKEAVAKSAQYHRIKAPLVIGVTELTSRAASFEAVLKRARQGYQAGIDGVVCSAIEAQAIKSKFPFCVVTPGIRKKDSKDDQKRTATINQALSSGADYLVIGRPLIKAVDYQQAIQELF
jgi:orotidine-5'-phosphate decarboxylase